MPLDLEYDSAYENGCNDVNDIGLGRPKRHYITENVSRSLDEILQLEVELIEENTEVDAELWIHLFAARFRAIMDVDSSGTKSQIKRKLYLNE